jgi:hypothetical protein
VLENLQLVVHIFYPYFGVGRYVRLIDLSVRFWLNRGAADKNDPVSELESPMNAAVNTVQIEQKSYEMPPLEGLSIAHFITVADIERSARYYEKVFGASILSMGDGNAPAYLRLANIWMILNVGAGRLRISRR